MYIKLVVTTIIILTSTLLNVSLSAQAGSLKFSKNTFSVLKFEVDYSQLNKLETDNVYVDARNTRKPYSRITQNGYRFDDGQIYTMRIKVPNDSGSYLQRPVPSGNVFNPDFKWISVPKKTKKE